MRGRKRIAFGWKIKNLIFILFYIKNINKHCFI
jgi:hypothetical protein